MDPHPHGLIPPRATRQFPGKEKRQHLRDQTASPGSPDGCPTAARARDCPDESGDSPLPLSHPSPPPPSIDTLPSAPTRIVRFTVFPSRTIVISVTVLPSASVRLLLELETLPPPLDSLNTFTFPPSISTLAPSPRSITRGSPADVLPATNRIISGREKRIIVCSFIGFWVDAHGSAPGMVHHTHAASPIRKQAGTAIRKTRTECHRAGYAVSRLHPRPHQIHFLRGSGAERFMPCKGTENGTAFHAFSHAHDHALTGTRPDQWHRHLPRWSHR
jgi:hypothetical protein